MPIRFDAKEHKYWHYQTGCRTKTEVPSVTSILKRAGLSDIQYVPEAALQRGTDVHAEIAGSLRFGWRYEISKYATHAMRFLVEVNAEIISFEKIVFEKTLWYAGRIDLVCRIDRRVYLLDWKVNTVYKSVGPQLAAYAQAWNTKAPVKHMIEKRGVVRLTEDTYQFIDADSKLWPTKASEDFGNFRKCLEAQCTTN